MIKVSNLSKKYVGKPAVDNISFNVESGEIVGFLGPNGAGKTTTIRMLTGYIPPTSGTALIGGYDIFLNSLIAKQKIGYMPENVPLYDDMRVREYLLFRAELKGLRGQDVRKHMNEALELCSIKDIKSQMISSLSKGFRQRVGLADALINKPPLLILDEPTNGLDPSQIRSFRELIKELAENHTILISTHILSEVELTCDRVLIINKGKMIGNNTPLELSEKIKSSTTISLELKSQDHDIRDTISNISGIKKVTLEKQEDDWKFFRIRVDYGNDLREEIMNLGNKRNWLIREIHYQRSNLEDAYIEMIQNKDK
ncbi:MAG: ABC transporter ATP-binding protein [Verrucomicrobiales bacterium]|nr:ABC transporter ATP-binding protein [Verrucomicrobiota bacterium]MEC9111472.1 ABC transporter ATP-binding protein [Verrucomicrobiota bacterium]